MRKRNTIKISKHSKKRRNKNEREKEIFCGNVVFFVDCFPGTGSEGTGSSEEDRFGTEKRNGLFFGWTRLFWEKYPEPTGRTGLYFFEKYAV